MKTNHFLNHIQAKLDQLNTREKTLVTYGGLFAGVLVTWFGLIEPALLQVQNAPNTQAALLQKAGQVMRAAQELEELRSVRSRVVLPEGDVQNRLQQLLEEQGMAKQTTLLSTEEGGLRVEFQSVPATAFLAWIARVESISNLRLNMAEIEKVEAGVLNGHVTLFIQ